MSTIRSSMICDRVRAQISFELDGEPSQLERAMVAAHLERCLDCRGYKDAVTALTDALRTAPLEPLRDPIVLPLRRRWVSLAAAQVGVAAALAIAALGVAGQVGAPEQQRADSSPTVADLFETGLSPERELAQVDADAPGRQRPGPMAAV